MGEFNGNTTAEEPLISVIVPVYNVENYLRECVESILAQHYGNLEIIMVDDGSTDTSGAICDEYAQSDNRVQVIHQENGGLSRARNTGLRACKGEYLLFVDSDDWLECDTVSVLYRLISKHGSQLAIGGYQRVEDGSYRILRKYPGEREGESLLTKQQAMADFFRNGCAAWARLYRREIHDGLYFPDGEINEDEAIVLQILERCETVAVTDQIIYNYRCRPESITTSSFSEKKLAWYRHCENNYQWIKERYPELEELAFARYRSSIIFMLSEIAKSDGYQTTRIELRNKLRALRAKMLQTPFANKREKLHFLLVAYFPFPLYKLYLRLTEK
ncbi:MAG: glycosyltransferase family 2 protein [Acutalibacteraceae bacterium]